MNWNSIRPLQGAQQEGFEEFVCQLARKEEIEGKKQFIRKGKPDAGVECYWICKDGSEIAWQAKYFLSSLTNSQWGQIDKSVNTALDKHPKLKRYYIAIPNDPSDARLDEQESMLDKWNKRVSVWKKSAEKRGIDVEFLPWWSSDMISMLQRPENAGLNYYWFNRDELNDEWLNDINKSAIVDLGKRYTPENHVELETSKIFSAISRDEDFENQFSHLIDLFLIKYGKFINKYKRKNPLLTSLNENVDLLRDLFNNTQFKGGIFIDYKKYLELIKKISNILDQLYVNIGEETNEIEQLKELNYSIYDLENFCFSEIAILSNLPALLIEGAAGIGKSHLLADTVVNRSKSGKGSLLLLGQHFVTDEDPWCQILKKLHLKCNPDEFLGALNAKAQITGNRFIIFIDALNEGRGRYFWNDNLKSFLHTVSKYEWVGLVLSIRSSYVDLIAPKDEINNENIIRHRHIGFASSEYEASKIFFSNYEIELPNVPLLYHEFQNPLFLRLFCEGLNKAGYKKIPDGIQGITSIIDLFINGTNDKLHKPNELDYPKSVNVVRKAIEALMKEKTSKNLQYIEYERAFNICDEILKLYSSKRNLIDHLISEGVLSKNCYYISKNQYEEGVYLTYERFEDHLIASNLLYEGINLDEEFSQGGKLFKFIEDGDSCYENRGIIEALSIQLPEKFSKELYEFTDHLDKTEKYVIMETLINSLLWRKMETLHDGLVHYMNNTVIKHATARDILLDTMINISSIPGHRFNALTLHKILFNIPMADRDAWWSISPLCMNTEDSTSIKRLIDWSWDVENKSYISDESTLLSSIAISWFLCTPNRIMRDYATKALVSLLQHRLHLVKDLLIKFEGINDPHIYERLFAVAYGASLRASSTDNLAELSEYVFETIFKDKEEVYPHILLRDYARGIIEYANHLDISLTFDIDMVRPPYKSEFPTDFLINEEIDLKYKIDYNNEGYQDYHRGQNVILSSMTTEYGRGGGYGDFGRYTFQRALKSWNVNPDQLSNKAVEWIFEKYGYDVEKHGRHDSFLPYYGRKPSGQERIGKKYQWIALYEMLARVADNVQFDNDGYYSNEKNKYIGTWNPYVRDIDPTLLIKDTGEPDEDLFSNFWWANQPPIETNLTNEKWISNNGDVPIPESIISIKDNDGNDWLVLEGYPEWNEKRKLGEDQYDSPHKFMWWQIRSYLVKENDFDDFMNWGNNQDIYGVGLPKSDARYEVFHREYYWSSAYHFFQQDYYGGELWHTISYDKGDFNLMLTTDNYLWEEEFDFSKERAISILKPGQHIFEKMKLKYSQNDGEFIDKDGHVICFDPSVSFDSNQYLLIRKEDLLQYLDDNHLKIAWTVIGEKQILGGLDYEDRGILEMSGIFNMTDNKILGNLKFKEL